MAEEETWFVILREKELEFKLFEELRGEIKVISSSQPRRKKEIFSLLSTS